MDFYNALNSSAIRAYNLVYGPAYLNPVQILDARIIQFGGRFRSEPSDRAAGALAAGGPLYLFLEVFQPPDIHFSEATLPDWPDPINSTLEILRTAAVMCAGVVISVLGGLIIGSGRPLSRLSYPGFSRSSGGGRMSRFVRVGTRVVGLLALLLSAAPAWAQDAGIAGVAKDTSGAVLPGVTVTATQPRAHRDSSASP